MIATGEHETSVLLEHAQQEMISRGINATDIEYFTAVDNTTLEPIAVVTELPALFVMAVRVDGVRLIDNVVINRVNHGVSP
jgi:pantothenate synthetase